MSCERYRGWMMDAAADELPPGRAAELEKHARECSPCHLEFQRARMLLAAINLGVAAQTAAEPSPRFLEQVRRCIRDEASVAAWWNARWVPVAACAVVLIVATSVWTLWPRTRAPRELTASSATLSPAQVDRPAGVASTVTPRVTPEQDRAMVTLVRQARKRSPQRITHLAEVPEIIVPPGQMEAVLRFVQALDSRQIDGAKLLADLKAADQPLEIKPLMIASLDSLKLTVSSAAESSAVGPQQNFVSGEHAGGTVQ